MRPGRYMYHTVHSSSCPLLCFTYSENLLQHTARHHNDNRTTQTKHRRLHRCSIECLLHAHQPAISTSPYSRNGSKDSPHQLYRRSHLPLRPPTPSNLRHTLRKSIPPLLSQPFHLHLPHRCIPQTRREKARRLLHGKHNSPLPHPLDFGLYCLRHWRQSVKSSPTHFLRARIYRRTLESYGSYPHSFLPLL